MACGSATGQDETTSVGIPDVTALVVAWNLSGHLTTLQVAACEQWQRCCLDFPGSWKRQSDLYNQQVPVTSCCHSSDNPLLGSNRWSYWPIKLASFVSFDPFDQKLPVKHPRGFASCIHFKPGGLHGFLREVWEFFSITWNHCKNHCRLRMVTVHVTVTVTSCGVTVIGANSHKGTPCHSQVQNDWGTGPVCPDPLPVAATAKGHHAVPKSEISVPCRVVRCYHPFFLCPLTRDSARHL